MHPLFNIFPVFLLLPLHISYPLKHTFFCRFHNLIKHPVICPFRQARHFRNQIFFFQLIHAFQQCIHLFSAAHICCSHAHRQNYQPAPQNKQYAVPRISTEKQEYCEHCHCQKISRHIGNFIFPVLFPTHNVYLFSETPPHLHIYLVKLLFLSLFSMILLYHLYILKDMLIYVEFFPLYSYNLYKLFLYHLFYSL